MFTGFVHREVCGNTCKLWRYVCIQVLYLERFVVIHANCGDMYVYGLSTQKGLWSYMQTVEICMYTGCAQREVCGNTCKLWSYVYLQVLYPDRFVVIHANCGDMYT